MKHPQQQKKHNLLSNKKRSNAANTVGKFKQLTEATKKPSSNPNPNRAKFDSALSNLKERSKMNAKSRSDKIINGGLVLQQSILSPSITSVAKEESIIDQLLRDEGQGDRSSGATQVAATNRNSGKTLTNVYAALDEDYSRVKPLLLQPSILAQSLSLNTLQHKSNRNNIIDEDDI